MAPVGLESRRGCSLVLSRAAVSWGGSTVKASVWPDQVLAGGAASAPHTWAPPWSDCQSLRSRPPGPCWMGGDSTGQETGRPGSRICLVLTTHPPVLVTIPCRLDDPSAPPHWPPRLYPSRTARVPAMTESLSCHCSAPSPPRGRSTPAPPLAEAPGSSEEVAGAWGRTVQPRRIPAGYLVGRTQGLH